MIRSNVRVEFNRFDELKGRARRNAARNIDDTARRIAADWKARAPRDTGQYAASIRVDRSSLFRSEIVADATRTGRYEYSYPTGQEYGTRRHGAQPAARPAAEANEARFQAEFRRLFD